MNYPKYQKVVSKQIAKFGQVVTVRFPIGEAEYDPIKGEVAQEFLEADASAVFLSPDRKNQSRDTVVQEDARLLIGGDTLPQEPTEGCKVIIKGREWQVLSVGQVAPSGLILLYKLSLKRS